MSLSIPTQIEVPFADAGLKVAIPASSDNVTGRAGYDQGFPPINMTPKVAGGIPPFGTDMNGILFAATEAIQFLESGTGFVYDSAFSTAIGGYNAGARVLRTDGNGYWLNTVDANTVDPESAGGAAAGWVPDYTNGISPVTMTGSNVTLTPLQYGKPIIVISGLLTANLNLIFPNIAGQWAILNNTTGSFSVTLKTASGTGVVAGASVLIFGDGTNIYSSSTSAAIEKQIEPVTASVGSNALTLTLNPTVLDFRSATLGSGTVNQRTISTPISLVISSGSTLGTVSAVASRIVLIAIDNAGSVELAAVNLAGGVNLDETGVISTTAEGGAGAADSATVIYSTTARTNVPYRVVGYVESTQATAGTWATAPSTIAGAGGMVLAAMQSLGFGQTWQAVTRTAGVTYYNTSGKPRAIATVINATGASGSVSISINGGAAFVFANAAAGTGPVSGSGMFLIPPSVSYVLSDLNISVRTTYELF